MIKLNDSRRVQMADGVIRRQGGPAILRRDSGDRSCWACILHYKAIERQGNLRNPTDRRALISTIGLTVPPDSEQDKLVTLDPLSGAEKETLRIIAPIGKLAPAETVIYWDLQVRR
jgi:hypothetical protein